MYPKTQVRSHFVSYIDILYIHFFFFNGRRPYLTCVTESLLLL